jgi:hypothetical protein
VGEQQIFLELLGTESNTGTLVAEMIAQLVTLRQDGTNEPLLTPGSPRNEEKRRAGAVFPKLRQDQRSGGRVRTIIKG